MLLAIDIGNTNVVLALLDAEDRVLEERRAPSKDGWTAEQYAAQIPRAAVRPRGSRRGRQLGRAGADGRALRGGAGSGGRHGTGCQF